MIVLIYWSLYTLKQFLGAGKRSLILPWRVLCKFQGIQRLVQLLQDGLDPLFLARQAGCDVWLIPSLTFPHSLSKLKAATVILIPESPPWQDRDSFAKPLHEEMQRTALNRIAEATVCVGSPTVFKDPYLPINPAKVRPVQEPGGPGSRWSTGETPVPPSETDGQQREQAGKEWAQRWLEVFREAVELARWQSRLDFYLLEPWVRLETRRWRRTLDRQLVEPWPRLETQPASPRDPFKVFLFLPQIYHGGVLQASREIVGELAAINGERRRLDLTVGFLEGQSNIEFVERLGNAITFRRMRLNPIRRDKVIRLCGGTPAWLADRQDQELCFFSGAAQAAFQADAWFSLIDRFPLPLLPARPLGILVQDVIQRHFPEIFGALFFRYLEAGIIPTARSAEVIVTGTPQTHDDVIAAYGVDPGRVRLIPVACNPDWHFGQVTPRPVDNLREPFILNVTNCSPHKGADVMLRAYALLKRRLGNDAPLLVLCGYRTHEFSQAYRGSYEPPFHQIRRLVMDLRLLEGWDVVFLGPVSDEQLRYLYERCAVVVNAARYDNGCLCLAEGAYFGRAVISSRYSAAEFHAQRFGYPAHFFPVGDAAGLAEALHAALRQPPATAEDIHRAQARFRDPEFSFRRYGERFYDLLIQLAEKGRGQKPATELRLSA
jgi:glycosyltransferase involved in cell wall biosynthesis